jgi:hypothetical protein
MAAVLAPHAALASRPRRACCAFSARRALAPSRLAPRDALPPPRRRCGTPLLRIAAASEDDSGKQRGGGGGSKKPYLRNMLKVQLSTEEVQRLSKARRARE